MAKKIFKENQRFSGWEVIGLLAFFVVGLTYRFIEQHWISPVSDPMPILAFLAFVIPMVGVIWYLVNVKLSVKVTDKSISFKYSPFNRKKHKIKWDDVEDCEFLSSIGSCRTSGWDINFDHEKRFSLSGRSGVHLRTKQGENVLIGAKDMRGLKQAIGQALS